MEDFISLLAVLLLFIGFPICCYRCCCKRSSGGRIYNPPGAFSSVTVSLPPQQVNQQLPYPSVVPYPQQTPYPPQHATNPYYNMPMPPAGYNQTMGMQQSAHNPNYMG